MNRRPMRWGSKLGVALMVASVFAIGTAIHGALTKIQVKSEPIIVGNYVRFTAINEGPPPNPIDHFEWKHQCGSGPCSAKVTTLPSRREIHEGPADRLGGFILKAQAIYGSNSDPRQPLPPKPSEISRTFAVLGPDTLFWSWEPNPAVQRFLAPQGVGVKMRWQVRRGNQPIGPYASPTVEERVFRKRQWGATYPVWGRWSGSETGRFWYESSTATIYDNKITPFDYGQGHADGNQIDECYQQIRLIFPMCCSNQLRIIYLKTVTIKRFRVDNDRWRIEAVLTDPFDVPSG